MHEPPVLRCRPFGVAALGLVAIGGGEPYVDVLAGLVPFPARHPEYQALRPGGLGDDLDDLAEAPGDPPVGLPLVRVPDTP